VLAARRGDVRSARKWREKWLKSITYPDQDWVKGLGRQLETVMDLADEPEALAEHLAEIEAENLASYKAGL
jgi:hypothetical protein